jgi:hypothetical protein
MTQRMARVEKVRKKFFLFPDQKEIKNTNKCRACVYVNQIIVVYVWDTNILTNIPRTFSSLFIVIH